MMEEIKEKPRRGRRPRPLFSERYGSGGYIEIKYADIPHGTRNQNWKTKQVYVYEQYYNVEVDGKKDAVIFLDGNRYNFDINNLMLVSRRVLTVINRQIKLTNNRDTNLAIIRAAMLKLQMGDLAEKCGLVFKYGDKRRIKMFARENARRYKRKLREKKKNTK